MRSLAIAFLCAAAALGSLAGARLLLAASWKPAPPDQASAVRVEAVVRAAPERHEAGSPFDALLGSLASGSRPNGAVAESCGAIERARAMERGSGKPDASVARQVAALDAALAADASNRDIPWAAILLDALGIALAIAAFAIAARAARAHERTLAELAAIVGADRARSGLGRAIRDTLYAARLGELRARAAPAVWPSTEPRSRSNEVPPIAIEPPPTAIELPAILLQPPGE